MIRTMTIFPSFFQPANKAFLGHFLSLPLVLLLFEENTEFIKLSSGLRDYFEENILQRRNVENDSEWFDQLKKFFEFIIGRRIFRIEEWFNQNISRFPEKNNEVSLGKYALGKEIDKLTLLWTLCSLSCENCNLCCIKVIIKNI